MTPLQCPPVLCAGTSEAGEAGEGGAPAEDFRARVILVDLNVVTYSIGCIQPNYASHLQLLLLHDVLQDQHLSVQALVNPAHKLQ